MTTTNHIFSLTVGDWSCDGHNHYEDCYFTSNYMLVDVVEAYNKTVEKYGIDLTKQCKNYEDCILSKEFVDIYMLQLSDLEGPHAEYFEEMTEWLGNNDNEWYVQGADDWCEIYLRMASLSLPDLWWDPFVAQNENIGGYGIFVM